MERPNTSNILNFVSIRAPNNYKYDNDIVEIIRDSRIQYLPTPDEGAHSVEMDTPLINKTWVGQFLMDVIPTYLTHIDTLEAAGLDDEKVERIREYNYQIAMILKRTFLGLRHRGLASVDRTPLSETIDAPHVDDMVTIIKGHISSTFNKKELILELNEVLRVRKLFGIDFYMRKGDRDISLYLRDYYDLFDRLYILYICKRIHPINLEYVIDGLRALHVLDWLSFDLDSITLPTTSDTVMPLSRPVRLLTRLIERPETRNSSRIEATAIRALSKEFMGGLLPTSSRLAKYHPTLSFRINTKEDLSKAFNAVPFIHPVFAYLLHYYRPFNFIRPVGIGDLKVVKQWLCGYEKGEIAHIENVLQGEVKEQIHRRLDRTEDILNMETENIEETEKQLQTTERYEMEREVDKTIQENFDISNETNIVYKGIVSVENTLGIAYNTSSEDASKNASKFAREITSHSAKRIKKRTLEQRSLRRLFEVEETKRHGFNNEKGRGHVTGIYRFLDKRYRAQVFNYGKRLMFEFVIPEPGSFYLEAFDYLNKKAKLPSDDEAPKAPTLPTEKVHEMSEAIITKYGAEYPIEGVKPFPIDLPDYDASFSIEKGEPNTGSHSLPDNGTNAINFSDSKQFPIPENRYAIIRVSGEFNAWHKSGGDHGSLQIKLGSTDQTFTSDFVDRNSRTYFNIAGQDYPTGTTYTLTTQGVKYFRVTFHIIIRADNLAAKDLWRQDTYDKLMAAYNKAYQNYVAEKAKYDNKKESLLAELGAINTRGKNARINQQIINDELQKHSITLIAKQFDTNVGDDEHFNAVSSKEVIIGKDAKDKDIKVRYPVIDIEETKKEGPLVQFLQQAFEWHNLSYSLYPYFWANESQWLKRMAMYDENLEDPLFGAFLRAGYARVLVAVRPNYEIPVMHYLYTREPWNGGSAPGIYDPLYVPIDKELREQQDEFYNAKPVGQPWEYILPTSLLYLEQEPNLPPVDCTNPADG